jgi:hypothetical protein
LSQKHFVDLFSCFIECGLARVDLVIILDSSTSVGDDNYLKMKNFCKDFLKNADLDSGNVRAGILSYSTSVHAEFYLNSYSTTQEIMDAIVNIGCHMWSRKCFPFQNTEVHPPQF